MATCRVRFEGSKDAFDEQQKDTFLHRLATTMGVSQQQLLVLTVEDGSVVLLRVLVATVDEGRRGRECALAGEAAEAAAPPRGGRGLRGL